MSAPGVTHPSYATAKSLDMVRCVCRISLANAWLPGTTNVSEIIGNVLVSEKWQAFLLFGSSLLCFVPTRSYTMYYSLALSSICD